MASFVAELIRRPVGAMVECEMCGGKMEVAQKLHLVPLDAKRQVTPGNAE